MNSVWTEDEKEFIRVNAGELTDAQLAARLTETTGREVSLQAARKQRQKLQLRKCHGRGVCRLAGGTPGVPAKPKGMAFAIKGADVGNS